MEHLGKFLQKVTLGGAASSFLHRLILAIVLALACFPKHSAAVQLSVGLGLSEEGDDRQRPSLTLQGLIGKVAFKEVFYGREFGPVVEKTYITSVGYQFDVKMVPSLFATVGGTFLQERTTIDTPTAEQNDTNNNLGAWFGLHWRYPNGPTFIQLSWDSHLFLAGAAGILLATGRKQTLAMACGMRL